MSIEQLDAQWKRLSIQDKQMLLNIWDDISTRTHSRYGLASETQYNKNNESDFDEAYVEAVNSPFDTNQFFINDDDSENADTQLSVSTSQVSSPITPSYNFTDDYDYTDQESSPQYEPGDPYRFKYKDQESSPRYVPSSPYRSKYKSQEPRSPSSVYTSPELLNNHHHKPGQRVLSRSHPHIGHLAPRRNINSHDIDHYDMNPHNINYNDIDPYE